MKAKEYYAKYGEPLKNPDTSIESARAMILEMLDEVQMICNIRHIKLDSGFKSVLLEQNGKWNSLTRMFDPPVLKPNGFIEYVQAIMAEPQKGE